MKSIQYRVTVKHDKGTIKIITRATDKETASKLIQDAEHCPASAIKKIEEVITGENVGSIINIPAYSVPDQVIDWLKENATPEYKDNTGLREDLYSVGLYENDVEQEGVPQDIAPILESILKAGTKAKAAYFRFSYL